MTADLDLAPALGGGLIAAGRQDPVEDVHPLLPVRQQPDGEG
jgi:hypothetical protein